jgi:transposase
MSMIEIMDSFMNETGNGSAVGTGNPVVARQVHRQYAIELNRRIVEETFAPGSSVSIVARRHDVNANLVLDWREKYRQGTLVDRQAAARSTLPTPDQGRIGVVDHDGGIRPVTATGDPSAPSASPPRSTPCDGAAVRESRASSRTGTIEIELPNRVKVRADAGIGEAALRRVLAVAGAMA